MRQSAPCQLTTSRLFDLVFSYENRPNGVLCMLYECFLDDSKDGHQEFSYVCAGFYGTRTAWETFNTEWNRQLKREGIDYFKTSEFKSLTGQFKKYKSIPKPHGREGANLVRQRLEEVLRVCPGIHGVGVVVPVMDYNAVLRHEHADSILGPNVYSRAFESTMLKATHVACGRKDQIAFAHDEGPDFDTLRKLYRSFKERNPYTASMMKGFIPLDDKEHPPLQIADMLANSVMGTVTSHIKGNEVTSNDIFMFSRSNIYVWSQKWGESVLRQAIESMKVEMPKTLC